ncbi:MAG: response regulator [Deltaproteobacteria bacterium]|nr:response regulator [Candidatus Zymogenaceae bacterium]
MEHETKKVLIVNSGITYSDFLKWGIEKVMPSLSIAVAESGEKALELTGHNGYDLVITDRVLPGMGGVNLFYELKERYPLLKTILLSDCFDIREMKALEKEGLFGYIEKPFLLESLSELIERAFRS